MFFNKVFWDVVLPISSRVVPIAHGANPYKLLRSIFGIVNMQNEIGFPVAVKALCVFLHNSKRLMRLVIPGPVHFTIEVV